MAIDRLTHGHGPGEEHVRQVCEPYGCQQVRFIYNMDDPERWFCVGIAEKGPEANPDDRIFLCISTRDSRTGEPSRFTFHMNKADIAVLVHMLGEVLAVALGEEFVDEEEVEEDEGEEKEA